ncbi:MAG: hypothetical protein N2C12_01615, partial [Planctomycetales bacterium]
LATYDSVEGRDYVRRVLRYYYSLGHHNGSRTAVSAAVRVSCLTDITITDAINALLTESAQRALNLYANGHYKETDLKDLLYLWRGTYTKGSFNRLARKTKKHDPELFHSAVFVIGNKFAMAGKDETASFMFQYVLEAEDVHPLVKQLTQQQMAKIKNKQSQESLPAESLQ